MPWLNLKRNCPICRYMFIQQNNSIFFILLLQCYDSYNHYYYNHYYYYYYYYYYHHYYYYCYYYHYYYYSYQYDCYYHYDFIIMGNYSSNNLINLLSINHYHVQLEKFIFSWKPFYFFLTEVKKNDFCFFHLFCWQFDHTYLIFINSPIFFCLLQFISPLIIHI